MTTKLLEIVVCDLCRIDRPAVNHREVDVCTKHDEMLDKRAEEAGGTNICADCGRRFKTPAGLNHHRTVTHG
jgi:hypothetical protein